MLLFHAAIKKISNVGILLRLRQTIIADADAGPNLRQNVFVIVRSESNSERKRSVVNGKTDKIDLRPTRHIKLAKAGHRQCSCKLSRTIWPKVEKDYCIAILDRCYGITNGINDDIGFNKLVGNTLLI